MRVVDGSDGVHSLASPSMPMAALHKGYCNATAASAYGACDRGHSGSWGLTPADASDWATAESICRWRCLRCRRCNYISISLRWQDCSWFHRCDVSALHSEVPGHRTMEVREPAQSEPEAPPADESMLPLPRAPDAADACDQRPPQQPSEAGGHVELRWGTERPARAASYALARDDTSACDEEAVYGARCGAMHRRMERLLTRARERRRGLLIEYLGTSYWGLGHTLPAVYLLHALCVRLERYCYVKLLDTRLARLFGYANGWAWEMTEEERGRYRSTASVEMASGRDPIEMERDWLPRLRNVSDAELIHVKVAPMPRPAGQHEGQAPGAIPLASELFLPTLPWDKGHRRKREEGAYWSDELLGSRCFCRFVASPRVGRSGNASVAVAARRAHPTTYHLRTGFADVSDHRLRDAVREAAEAKRWLSLACPKLRPESVNLITDSPGVARLTGNGGRGGGVRSAAAGARTTRTWASPIAADRKAVDDALLASSSREIFTARESSFVRPVAARSLCVERVFVLADPVASACARFHAFFPRDMQRLLGHRRLYACFRQRAPRSHPCSDLSAGQCARSYLAATA